MVLYKCPVCAAWREQQLHFIVQYCIMETEIKLNLIIFFRMYGWDTMNFVKNDLTSERKKKQFEK